jgi:general secretion pathway protein D
MSNVINRIINKNNIKKVSLAIFKHTAALVLVIMILLIQGVSAQQAELPAGVQVEQKAVNSLRNGRVLLNFEGADIRVVAKLMSELTNRNIILDDRVRGNITILSAREVTPPEAWEMFKSALSAYGFGTVSINDRTIKIVPVRTAVQEKSQFYTDSAAARSGDYLVAVIGLKHADANQVVNALKPLSTPDLGVIVAYQPSSSLLIADEASIVQRLIKITKHLDTVRNKALSRTIFLQYANSSEVVKVLEKMYPSQRTSAVITDYASYNAVILMAPNDLLNEMVNLVNEMDQRQVLRNVRRFRVVQLENANAEEMAKILSEMLREGERIERESSRGRPPVTATVAADGDNPTGTPDNPSHLEPAPAGAPNARTPGSATFASSRVSADKETNSIILYVTDFEMEEIQPLIARLDVLRRQVLVSAIIAEVTERRAKNTGANWQVITDKGYSAGFGGGKSLDALYQILAAGNFVLGGIGGKMTRINIGGRTLEFPNVFSLIQFLNEDNDFQILSTPRILTQDHKKAVMNVGSIIPFASGIKFDANGQPIITYDYKDVGLNLTVTPHVGQGELITLEVEQRVQDVTDFIQQNLGAIGYVVPVVSTRNIQTTITLGNNQTVIIGGLVSRKTIESVKKVPILGDIPLIGAAFRNYQKENQKTTLFVFLTPHVIDDPRKLVDLTQQYQEYMHDNSNSSNVRQPIPVNPAEQKKPAAAPASAPVSPETVTPASRPSSASPFAR